MDRFQHTPDDVIVIKRGDSTYSAALADFRADLATIGAAPYPGLVERIGELYRPAQAEGDAAVLHASFVEGSQLPPTLDETLLLEYILSLDSLLGAKNDRDAITQKRAAADADARSKAFAKQVS